jgi:putative DNA primase/helicase
MLRHYCITESKGASVPSLKVVTEATFRLGYDNRINPLKDYLLNELRWDGIERAKQWTIIACGAEDTELTHEMSEKFLIGLVKRPLEPGCKFDTVLVFEGPEGLGKSTTFAILAGLDHPERFFDSPIIHEPALDRQALMQGRWVIEIAELADIKRGDMKKVNGFLSRLADPARVLYTNLSIDRPRTCVFAGTTTDSEYLRNDQNRRFWCLKIKRIQLDWLTNNREQLLAEAVHKYKNGESTVLPERLWGAARIMQKQRRIRDDWEEVLEDILTWPNVTKIADPAKWPDPAPTIPVIKEIYNNQRKVLFVSSSLLLTKALKITPDRMRGGASHRLAAAMRELGWIREQVFGEGRGYIKALPGDKPLTDELENEETHDDETIKAAGGGAVNSESNEGENEDTGYDEIEADDEAGDNEETESDNENIEEEEGNEP